MSEAMQQWVKQWDGIWALQMTNKMTINEIIDYLDLPVAEVEKLAEEDSIKMNEYGARSLMLVLFDDPQIMKNHDAYLTRTVTERVIKRVNIMSIKKIMYKLHFTEEEAMDALDIPEEERNRYKKMLEKE